MSRLRGLARTFDKELLTSIRWQYFLNIGIGILGAAFILTLGRLLGSQWFGIYTLCVAIPSVVAAVLDSRLQEFVLYINEHADRPELRRILVALLWFDLLGKVLIVTLSIAICAIMIALDYSGLSLGFVSIAAGLVLGSKAMSGPAMGILRARGLLEVFSIAQVADWFFRLLALGTLYLVNWVSIESVLWSQVVIGTLFNGYVVRRACRSTEVDIASLRLGLGGMIPVLSQHRNQIFGNQAISAMDVVVKELDVLVCGIFLSPTLVGTYKIAKSLSAIAWRLADPIYIVILPKLARLRATGRSVELVTFTRHLTAGLSLAAIALYCGAALGVALIGPLAVGPEYSEALTLYPLASVWIVIALPLVWTHSLAIASARPVIQFLGGGIGNSVGLVAIWLGSAHYGVRGALVGLSLAYCLPFAFSFYFLRRYGVLRW